MMSDEKLLDAFMTESKLTGRLLDGIRAVRISVEATLQDEAPPPTDPDFQLIAELVALATGIPAAEIVAGARPLKGQVLHARWLVGAVAHELGVSYPRIAAGLGISSHALVLKGVVKIVGDPALLAIRDRVLGVFTRTGLSCGRDRRPASAAAPSAQEQAA